MEKKKMPLSTLCYGCWHIKEECDKAGEEFKSPEPEVIPVEMHNRLAEYIDTLNAIGAGERFSHACQCDLTRIYNQEKDKFEHVARYVPYLGVIKRMHEWAEIYREEIGLTEDLLLGWHWEHDAFEYSTAGVIEFHFKQVETYWSWGHVQEMTREAFGYDLKECEVADQWEFLELLKQSQTASV